MPDLTRLDDLRRDLESTDDFSGVLSRFISEFAEDPDFLRRGFHVDEPVLAPIVEQIVRSVLGEKAVIGIMTLRRLTPVPFVHGAVIVDGLPGLVFWFEDRDVGLFAVPSPGLQETHLCRFRTVVAEAAEVSRR